MVTEMLSGEIHGTLFLVLILLLLVIMGMNNRQTVGLSLPPI